MACAGQEKLTWLTMHWFPRCLMKQLSGKQSFEVSSITEVHARYIREGRIKLDKSKVTETVVYHDPCALGRGCGIYDEPRQVLQSIPGLELVEHAVARRPTTFPYVPGLLLFRKIPALLNALDGLHTTPDLVLCDGQGVAHPRRFGLACHLGVLTGLP